MLDPFADILGHERVKTALTRAAGSGRIHHAWLFAGRDGVGKTMLARRFAQLLMCDASSPGAGEAALAACGSCRQCRRIESDSHPDLTQLRAKGQGIRIAQVRELQQTVSFKPFEARYRVVIFHEAHRILDAAANALLKTLEEPTEQTIFVLLTDQLHQLLPTIISRCQVVRFAPFEASAVTDFLEQREVPTARAELVAVLAEGSLARALELADEEHVAAQLEAIAAVEQLAIDDPATVLEAAASLASDKEQLPPFLAMLRAFVRDLMLVHEGLTERIGLKWRLDALRQRAAAMNEASIAAAFDAIGEAEEALAGNVNPTLVAEHLLFTVAACFAGRVPPPR